MKVTVKTDKFIELLNGVIFRLYPMFYKVDCSDELLEIITSDALTFYFKLQPIDIGIFTSAL